MASKTRKPKTMEERMAAAKARAEKRQAQAHGGAAFKARNPKR